jgi:hypothetical protein
VVQRTEGKAEDDLDVRVTLDGVLQEGRVAPLVDDRQPHRVDVQLATKHPLAQLSVA